ncbi:hypothetical protein HD806DRAFT_509747 [Xylariaceae sp. AK1471]|nr:hypothetical protein HD806DRAFT_509747 [Xylariaceae sp. AK1471]
MRHPRNVMAEERERRRSRLSIRRRHQERSGRHLRRRESFGDFQPASVDGDLLNALAMTLGAIDSDPAEFAYAGRQFSSVARGVVGLGGGHEDGNREMWAVVSAAEHLVPSSLASLGRKEEMAAKLYVEQDILLFLPIEIRASIRFQPSWGTVCMGRIEDQGVVLYYVLILDSLYC